MASSTFGITAASVRSHHLPRQDAFSASSQPTLATVTEAIAEEAAAMAGKLALELVTASAITANSDAYKACARILRMQCAARIALDMLGMDSDLVRSWQATVADWYEALADGGASFLGDGASATGDSNADGPTSHVSVYGLTTDAGEDMSDTVPLLRKDDQL